MFGGQNKWILILSNTKQLHQNSSRAKAPFHSIELSRTVQAPKIRVRLTNYKTVVANLHFSWTICPSVVNLQISVNKNIFQYNTILFNIANMEDAFIMYCVSSPSRVWPQLGGRTTGGRSGVKKVVWIWWTFQNELLGCNPRGDILRSIPWSKLVIQGVW